MTPWLSLTVLALAAVSLAATLGLFCALKRQIWTASRAQRKQYDELIAARREVDAEVERLRAEFIELQVHTGMLVAPSPPASGLNIGKRSQAMRLLRRGDRIEQVCEALNLPRNEVLLLAKVEQIAVAPHPASNSRTSA